MRQYESCELCHALPHKTELHHIVPKRAGGEDEGNLIRLCLQCHGWVDRMLLRDSLQWVQQSMQRAPVTCPAWEVLLMGCLTDPKGAADHAVVLQALVREAPDGADVPTWVKLLCLKLIALGADGTLTDQWENHLEQAA